MIFLLHRSVFKNIKTSKSSGYRTSHNAYLWLLVLSLQKFLYGDSSDTSSHSRSFNHDSFGFFSFLRLFFSLSENSAPSEEPRIALFHEMGFTLLPKEKSDFAICSDIFFAFASGNFQLAESASLLFDHLALKNKAGYNSDLQVFKLLYAHLTQLSRNSLFRKPIFSVLR